MFALTPGLLRLDLEPAQRARAPREERLRLEPRGRRVPRQPLAI